MEHKYLNYIICFRILQIQWEHPFIPSLFRIYDSYMFLLNRFFFFANNMIERIYDIWLHYIKYLIEAVML